jgi:Rps23 Pro-64 3,4-dihydroxylase Tpa1-like proline 4-hydroxylase
MMQRFPTKARTVNPVATEPIQGPAVSVRASYFERDALQAMAEQLRPAYAAAHPFPHIVIDDFLPPEHLNAVVDELEGTGEIDHTQQFDNAEERKLATDDDSRLPPASRHLLTQFNSATFIEFLETLTGIDGLIPDPHFVGGGFHEIKRGGFLKVHADFNRHRRLRLDRRLNLLVYLNRDWKEEYGGHLELWSTDMKSAEQRILPVFNRCVIFSTTDVSYHGHPEPLTCPEDVSRRSLALYYYTNGRPDGEGSDDHGTLFRPRPGEPARAQARMLLRRLIPPIALDAARELRSWMEKRRSR